MVICLEQGEDLDQKCSCFVLAAGSKTEHVLFRTGSRYQYKSVPETYDTLIGFWYQLTGTGFWYQKLVCMCDSFMQMQSSSKLYIPKSAKINASCKGDSLKLLTIQC